MQVIFAIGGVSGGQYLHDVEYYDILNDKWNYVTPMPVSCSAAAAVAVGDKIYVIGGFQSGTISAKVLIYDTNDNSWSEDVPMSVPRANHGVALLDKRIYVVFINLTF